jgi:hypothetical protein
MNPTAPHSVPLTVACSRLLALAVTALWAAGCATQDANPPQPRSNTGYVDFHADPPDDLGWEVSRFEERSQTFQRVYSELKPPSGGVLRLAFAPGLHRLRITFLNRVIAAPVEIEVEVQDGKITPVRVTFTPAATTLVQTRDQNPGGTARGHYGRRYIVGSREATLYGLSAVADPPRAYQLKEQMHYAR